MNMVELLINSLEMVYLLILDLQNQMMMVQLVPQTILAALKLKNALRFLNKIGWIYGRRLITLI